MTQYSNDRVSSTDQELVDLATETQRIVALYQDSQAGSVGCALRSRSGATYTGICLDLHCGLGFCAEHHAVAEMLKACESIIETIVAVGTSGHVVPPCGRCRELLWQVDSANRKTRVIMPRAKVMSLEELLPEHWYEYLGADH